MHRQFVTMHSSDSHLMLAASFLLAVSLLPSCAADALSLDTDGNGTANGTAAGGGFVPVVFTKVNQIIAREGSCVLIDCNVTGEPVPSFQWFNSHGERLDTENGEPLTRKVTLNPVRQLMSHH